VDDDPTLEPRFLDPPDHTAACHFPVADGEDLAAARPQLAAEDRASDAVDPDLSILHGSEK
jgi:hypothetical protein